MTAPRPAEPVLPSAPNPDFDRWVAAFRTRAAGRGIAPATLAAAFRDAGYLPGVIERDRTQFQTRRTLEDYIAVATSDDRLAKGRAMVRKHAGLLAEIEARYGIEPSVVTAIWGLETNYGERRGAVPVISALATLAHAGRRGAFYETQLMAALRILQRGEVSPARMTGSWAGAMGHTQFIPTSYEAFAVDFRSDGRRDVWSDDPTDALASAAAYLKRSGWRQGQLWGIEVLAGADGVRDMDGRPVTAQGTLLRPAGPAGPAFLVFQNYLVLRRYNDTLKYAIAGGHLADRLAGGPPLRTPFAPDAQGLTLADRKELQRLLTASGYDTGSVDGVIGPQTVAAIRAYQRKSGLPVTGIASLALLRRLR